VTAANLLEVRDIHISYFGVEAVRGVTIKVAKGDFVCIIGANGAGKSSVFNAVSGLMKPASGEIWFNGERIDGLDSPQVAAKGINQVPEGRKIFPFLTVKENLIVGAHLLKDRKKIPALMERVFSIFPALKEKMGVKGLRLSGGQQQMLAIGRAMMASPLMMLLDEPSLGLSPLFVKNMCSQLKLLHSEGMTLLLVEQNARMALGLSKYGYVLETGELCKEGPSADLMQDEDVKKAYLGVSGSQHAASCEAGPEAVRTSFTAATYTNDEYGISVAYPRKWAIEKATPPAVFVAVDIGRVPGLWVSVFNRDTAQIEAEATWAAAGLTNVRYLIRDQEFRLRDGKTIAMYNVITADFPGAKLRNYSISLEKADRVISFAITCLEGLDYEALFKEIFATVTLK
jgi:branched-chain amino acid transport system ATP-binding protein